MSGPSPGGASVPSVDGFTDLVVLGKGGFSSVFAASDAVLGRRVALKVLNLGDRDQARFERECRILASLSEVPGIVPVYSAAATDDGRPVIVMKLLDGGSLSSLVADDGPLDVAEVLGVGERLCAAVGVAHDHGIFHRDIKPDNVLFSAERVPALGDFGIAMVAEWLHTTETLASLSPPFAPPERYAGDGKALTVASDVYSLAATLYFALNGAPPFGSAADEGGLVGLMRRVTSSPLPPLARDDVPDGVTEVLATAMAKSPDDRFSSMEQFAEALRSARAGQVGSVPHASGPTPEPGGSGPTAGGSASVAGLITAGSAPSGDPAVEGAAGWNDQFDGEVHSSVRNEFDSGVPALPAAGEPSGSAPSAAPSSRLPDRRRAVVAGIVAAVSLVLIGAGIYYFASRGSDSVAAGRSDSTETERTSSGESSSNSLGTTEDPEVTEPAVVEPTALAECIFTGSATLSPGVLETPSPQVLQLGRGSLLECTLESGAVAKGTLDFDAAFEALDFNHGDGAGECAMSWNDGTTSTCTAEVQLSLPTIAFRLAVVDGPYVGQLGIATLQGWEPIFSDDGLSITDLTFAETTITFDDAPDQVVPGQVVID